MQKSRDGRNIQVDRKQEQRERIMVCIGANPRSIRLIQTAKQLANDLDAEWIAVTVEAPAKVSPSRQDLLQLANHIHLAENLGAETVTLPGHSVSQELLSYARSRNITRMIIGKPTHARWKDRVFGSVLDEVVRGSGDIDVNVVSGDDSASASPSVQHFVEHKPRLWRNWVLSVGSVVVFSAVAALMHPHFTLVDLAMVYLLGIVWTASRLSWGPTLLTTLLSVATFNFLFIPPLYTFTVEDIRYVVTFAVMFVVAIVISRLNWRVREQANRALQREHRTAALYHLSRELAHAEDSKTLCSVAIQHLNDIFSCQSEILIPDTSGDLIPSLAQEAVTTIPAPNAMKIAQWSFVNGQKAGFGTEVFPESETLYLPLIAAGKPVGVVELSSSSSTDVFGAEQVHILESFANQTAMALERAFLAKEAQQAQLQIEKEILRNTLLSSVSHDLRTPLAAITGAGTTLLQNTDLLTAENQSELLQTIVEESAHLNRIIRNVLDMTRLESGGLKMTREWQSIEEIVGAVTNRMAEQFLTHPLGINLPHDLPLIPCDELLIEQVMRNLLENATKHTPAGTEISLSAQAIKENLQVTIADNGPGIPESDHERIFEKFVRGNQANGGVGLGLAICREIISIHGGRIWVDTHFDGGSSFSFTLPLAPMPPIERDQEEYLLDTTSRYMEVDR